MLKSRIIYLVVDVGPVGYPGQSWTFNASLMTD